MVALTLPWFRLSAWEIPLPFLDSPLAIQPFGVLVATGVLVGMRVVDWYAERNGLQKDTASEIVGYVVVCGFLGAYFLNALFYHPEYLVEVFNEPSRIFSRFFGLSSYGGFIGGIFGLWLWKRKNPTQSALAYGDAMVFALVFGWFFGRMGCFVVHDHPGAPSDFFLAVADYQVGQPPFVARHDLGLYEVIWSVFAGLVLLKLAKKRRPRGFYFAVIALMYAPVRFCLDFLRATDIGMADTRYAGLTPAQYASLFFLVVSAFLVYRISKFPLAPEALGGTSGEADDGESKSSQGKSTPSK